MRRRRTVVVLLTLSFGISGCFGAFSPDEDEGNLAEYVEFDPDDEEDELECQGVVLSSEQAPPFERIEVDFDFEGEEPEGFGVELKLTGDDDDDPFLPVYRDTDGFYFSVPPHPSGIDGGDMELLFTDGEVTCEDPMLFEVEALAEAPGAIEDLIAESAELNRILIRSFGYEPQDVIDADADELPAILIPLAVQLWTLNHSDNPDSLLARLQADDLPVDHTEEELVFAEALLGASGHIENLQARQAVVQDLIDETEVDVGFRSTANLLRDDITETHQGLCSVFDGLLEVEIENDQDLSYYMRKGHRAVSHGERAERVSSIVGVLGLFPGPSAVAAAIVGLVMAVDQLKTNAHTDIYPRDLVEPKVEGLTTVFAEDFEERGNWSTYSVTAEAPGWDAPADILDALISIGFAIKSLPKGGVPMPGNVGARLSQYLDDFAAKAADEFTEEFLENVVGWLAENALSVANQEVIGESGFCVIEPGPWEDIPILNTSWLEIDYEGAVSGLLGEDAGEFCRPGPLPTSRKEYEPTKTGIGEVTIEPKRVQFPTRDPDSARFEEDISVNEIEVVLDPRERMGFPGQEIDIVGSIENAENRKGEWHLPDEVEEVSADNPEDGLQHLTAKLPDSEEDFPVFIALRSLADEGLRSDECDPVARSEWMVIRSEESLDIIPRHRCIAEGGSLQMEAIAATEDPEAEVQWTSSSGSIDENGFFEADSRGEVAITASVEGTELEETANIRVGSCGCFFDVRVSYPNMSVSGYDHVAATTFGDSLRVSMGDPETEIGANVQRNDEEDSHFEGDLATVSNEPRLGMLSSVAAEGQLSASRRGSLVQGSFTGKGVHFGEFFALLNDAGQPIPQEVLVSISFLAPTERSLLQEGICE